jgi:hypothetical protein
MYGFIEILFSNTRNPVDVVQVIEPTNAGLVGPVKPDQLYSRIHHLIAMAVKSRVDQYISRRGLYAAVVPRLFKAACHHNCRVAVKMTMPRQAEAAGQSLDSRRNVPKPRVVDGWRHA